MSTSVATRRPTLARSSALNFADGAISLTAALAVSVILARNLGPERFGLYALVMALVSFAYVFAQLGIPATVCRYVAELDGKGQPEIAAAVAGRGLRMGLISGTAAALLVSISAVPIAAAFHQPAMRIYLLLGAVRIVPMLGVGVLRGLFGGLQEYRYLLRLTLLISPAWLGGCALALWTGAGVAGVLLASLAAESLTLFALLWKAQRRIGIHGFGLPDAIRHRLIRYNWALAALVLLNVIIWQRSELLFLGRFWGPAQVSYYAVPFALIGRAGDLLPGAVLGVLIPSLTYAQGARDQTRFNLAFGNALRYLAILTLPLCLFSIPLAPSIIAVVYGQAFVPAAVVLQILLLSMIFSVLGQASQSALLGAESQTWLLKTGLASAVLSIALDLILIPRWGAIGAALANTVVQAVWALAIFAPLANRVLVVTRRAIMKIAIVAIALAALLSLFVVHGSTTTSMAAFGAGMVVVYGFALHRLNLFRLIPTRALVGH